jgi:hypothetical protein
MPQVTLEFYKYDSVVAEMLQQGFACAEIVAKILNTTATREQDQKVNSFRKYIHRHKKRILDQHEGIYQATNNLDVPNTSTKNMWIKNKEASLFVVNPNYKKPDEVKVEDIDFKKLFGEIKPFNYKKNPSVNECLFDRLVYTDTHIAMMITDYSLYGGIWNEDELFKMCDKMISHTIANRKSKVLYIDELGDFLDGYDGQTVRKGHHLPQNMDNQKAFDVGLRFKIKLVQSLIPYYDRIVCHNVCEDNHAGSFGYIVNSAFKTAIEMMLPNVSVINLRKFIEFYKVGKYIFVLSHGKDSVSLKFGFKPKLDKIQENKIDNYLDRNGLKGIIEFSKGDSHQYLFDNSTAQRFNYYNYPALSPSSAWVQINFQQGISGFIMFNYYEDRKVINECIINHSLTINSTDNG